MSTYSREQRILDLERRLKFYREKCKDLSFGKTAVEFQRAKAIRCLLLILDGDDPLGAEVEARAWLIRFFRGEANYKLMSHIENTGARVFAEMRANCEDVEWPEEMPGTS